MDAIDTTIESIRKPDAVHERDQARVLSMADGLIRDLDMLDLCGNQWIGADLITKREEALVSNIGAFEKALQNPRFQGEVVHIVGQLLSPPGYIYFTELTPHLRKIAIRHVQTILDVYDRGDVDQRGASVLLVNTLMVRELSEQRKEDMRKIMIDRIGQKVDTDEKSILNAELAFLLEYGAEDAQHIAKAIVLEGFGTTDSNDRRIKLVDASEFPLARQEIQLFLAEYLDSIGFDGKEVLALWGKNRNQWDIRESRHEEVLMYNTVGQNLRIINTLIQKGVNVSLLRKEYGITNFARFPVDMLERQAEQPKKRSIYMFYPLDDYNGAMSEGVVLDYFYTGLPKNTDVVVCEVGSVIDMKKKLLKLTSLFGKGLHGIIAGHGDEDGLRLGSTGRYYENHLTRQAFIPEMDGFGALFNNSFEEDANIILISCSTGSPMEGGPGGFARFATRHSRLTFVGPEVESAVQSLKGELKGGAVKSIAVHYIDPYTKKDVRAMKYKDGKLVE